MGRISRTSIFLGGNKSYVMGLNPIVLFLQDEHSFTSYFGRGFRMPGLTDSMDATGWWLVDMFQPYKRNGWLTWLIFGNVFKTTNQAT